MKKTLALLIGLSLYYLAVVYGVGFFTDPDAFLVRLAPDSLEYLEVADWLFQGRDSAMIMRRTFLYPLVIGILRMPAGSLGIWFVQMALWVGSAFLFYRNLEVLVARPWVRALFMLGFILCWTPILLSILILTETLCMFLFSYCTYVLIQQWHRWPLGRSLVVLVFCMGCQAAIKPNYMPLLFIFTLISLLICWRFAVAKRFVLAAVIVCVLLPLIQVLLHYQATGHADATNMSSHVLQYSLYPQVLAKVRNVDFMPVREEVIQQTISTRAMLGFLANHPLITFQSILNNLDENVRTVFHVHAPARATEHWLRRRLNDFFSWIHLAMAIPLLLALWRTRRLDDQAGLPIVLLGVLFIVGFLPTGISFWAADRWVAPLLPVWPLLYILVVRHFRRLPPVPISPARAS